MVQDTSEISQVVFNSLEILGFLLYSHRALDNMAHWGWNKSLNWERSLPHRKNDFALSNELVLFLQDRNIKVLADAFFSDPQSGHKRWKSTLSLGIPKFWEE